MVLLRSLGSGLAAAALLAGCPENGNGGPDVCRDGPGVAAVRLADTLLPGSLIEMSGTGFLAECGVLRAVFRGTLDGRPVEVEVDADVESATLARYEVDVDLQAGFAADRGRFVGDVGLRQRAADGTVRESSLPVQFELAVVATPRVGSVSPAAVTLNAIVLLTGDGFLEGFEGTSEVVLDGTFRPDGGGASRAVTAVRLPTTLVEPHDRTRAGFAYSPRIAGIAPGVFEGSLVVENRHATGAVESSAPLAVTLTVGRSLITGLSPANPSLGSIVTLLGAGFIGGASDQTLTVRLDGTATPHGGSATTVTDLELVPRFVDGGHAEYVVVPVATGGELAAEDFGFAWGTFRGTATPVLRYGAELVEGLGMPLEIALGPTKQVVHIVFQAAFSDTIRLFGLRAVEAEVRAQVLDKFRRTYEGIHVEARETEPEDYYPGGYAVLEIGGPDPNGRGLFGYDNTPGKDVGNLRLHDRVGGTNAEVQEDGYPGFGGVFVESFLCWSSHPPAGQTCPDGVSDPEFDRLFDPVRNREVVAGEYPGGPDPARTAEIAAAVRALGNVIGDTAAHEFGHSLGLANPYGPAYLVHHEPPGEGCLMDAGSYRPFGERAELPGFSPATWCRDDRPYLETILPVR
ncbi:MAG: hypothetical protein JXB32_01925 [Deltaproteobacteria bacterium]|nr:hypothetical protein [Deltaproteobacteria bacterium]